MPFRTDAQVRPAPVEETALPTVRVGEREITGAVVAQGRTARYLVLPDLGAGDHVVSGDY